MFDNTRRYIIAIHGGVEPSKSGPFNYDQEQIDAAREIDSSQNRDSDSLIWVDFDLDADILHYGTFSFDGEGAKISN